jgi:hypothetical protein
MTHQQGQKPHGKKGKHRGRSTSRGRNRSRSTSRTPVVKLIEGVRFTPRGNNKPKRVRKGKITGYVHKGFKKQGQDFSALTDIAKTICAPRDTNAIRLPDMDARLTDVKHLWVGGDITNFVAVASGQSDYACLTGDQTLPLNSNLLFLMRNPIAPLIYAVNTPSTWQVRTGGELMLYNWQLSGSDVPGWNFPAYSPQISGGSKNYMWIRMPSSFNVGASPNTPVVFTPAPDQSYLMPFKAVRDTTYSSVGGPEGVDEEPCYMTATDFRKYGFYGGGRFIVAAVLSSSDGTAALAVPAGGGITVSIRVARYMHTGDDDDDYGRFTVQISAGNSTACTVIQGAMPMGFYRFLIESIQFNAPTAASNYGNVGLRVAKIMTASLPSTTTGSAYANIVGVNAITQAAVANPGAVEYPTSYLYVNPPNYALTNSPYILNNARINSLGLLVTNVTPMISRGGDVYGLRINPGENWDDYSSALVAREAGAPRVSYRADLSNGCYTWMELSDRQYRDWYPSLGAANATKIASDSSVLTVLLDTGSPVHAIAVNSPSVTTDYRLQFRVDMHIEFMSTHQLVQNSISPYTLEDLRQATVALAIGPLFTENWIHLDKLWANIKSAGKAVLQAGGRAAGLAAMTQLSSGIAAMML